MRLSFQSLKFKIAGNLGFIILLSVLLSDFVIVQIIQKSMVRAHITHGKQYLDSLPDAMYNGLNSNADLCNERKRQSAGALPIPHLYIRFNNGVSSELPHADTGLKKKIYEIADQTVENGIFKIQFYGDTMGVFWKQKKYALIAEPMAGIESEKTGVKVAVVQLDHIYQALRDAQKIIVLYVLANFLLLLLFGVYRLSRLIVRPIHRFIKMTDDFRVKDRFYFAHGKNYQEFNQLSKALNHMMDMIETDKESLHQSLKELENANKELKMAQHEIVKAEKLASVGRLSAGIAHEIGNPIGIVLGYLDLLKSRPNLKNDAVGQDFLKRAREEINRINLVIRQLLDFSRSASIDRKIVSMHDLVKDVVRMMSDQPLMSDVDIDCRLANGITDTVYIDSDQIRQVLINLLINAADSIKTAAKKEKGLIQIFSEPAAGNESLAINNQPTFLLKVTDNGSGISDETIDYIFDPFFTTKEPGKGTGLGLAVSYMIIEQAGGGIAVASELGSGTTMVIRLPVHKIQ